MALEIFQKKVAGVPVVYLAAGAVAIFAVVAWRMKSTSGGDSAAEPPEDAELDEYGRADGSNPYAGYAGTGTVIVAPAPPPADDTDLRPQTNEEWARVGAEWLVAKKGVSGIAASEALYKYLNASSRSNQETEWINAVIKEKGLPPDPVEPYLSPPPNPKPSAPTKSATKVIRVSNVTTKGFKLDWEPIPGVVGYQLHIDNKLYGRTVVDSVYTVTGRKAKTSYKCTVYGVFPGSDGGKGPSDRVLGPGKTITVRTK